MPVKKMTLEEQANAAIDASMIGLAKPLKLWSANLVSAATMTPKAITWVWPHWMAQGKLHILAGAAGTGKTTLALGLIATLTSAGRWPDGERCRKAGNAILWSSEDDPEDTLIPRMIAMGADLNRVHILRGRISDSGEAEPFDPATDMPLLREAAARIGGVDLLMLDPIVSAISGDMHKANDVRRGLQAVVDFASEQGAAILGISHFSKGSAGSSPQDRVIGSQAFGALARVVLVAAKQEDGETRVLARAKSNITIDEGGVSYTIDAHTIDGGIETTRVMWGDRIEGSARDILGTVETGDDEESSELEDAQRFLADLLANGPVPTKAIRGDSHDAGYAWATIRRAQKKLEIEVYRDGDGIGSKSAWFWKLSPKVLIDWTKVLIKKDEHLSENLSTLGQNSQSDVRSEYAAIRG